MANPHGRRRNRIRLDIALLAGGALLLGLFFVMQAWSARERESAVKAFEEARASVPAASNSTIAPAREEHRPRGMTFEVSEPDYALWSGKRIEEYRASLAGTELPAQALLSIDHLNIRVPVYNGADELNLNRGVARIIGTGRFDLTGNLGIAGHRDGFFRGLKDIRMGDTFTVETLHGAREYVVSSIRIVSPDELSVLGPTDTPSVTLVTCYPFYFVGHAPKRFIVRGEVRNHPIDS